MKSNPDREVCVHFVPVNWNCNQCNNSNKSFINILKIMKENAKKAVKNYHPEYDDKIVDGFLQGRLSMIRDVIREYTNECD